ncbi:hypothetical protein GQ651_08550 [Alphaproteobacteria bacterium GH1-50]|uniref:Uncharacterized protein n=1 Tax=Kangsaoukella pontilimi TaxID=2691042 RepID=A0A7C9MWU1_9RHOB|nr:hypothetical protein [Kangsaoukella pontilimi]MXQ07894.1 hypothetical protein [Kangsaoukella pontilimi]
MEIIKNEAEDGKVFVNKLAAAERQLSAAIRMYFMEEDPLAIHTVASAAMNLYADLLKRRGKDPAIFGIVYGLLRAARDYIDGNLAKEDVEKWGDGAFEALEPFIEMLRNDPELNVDEIRVSGPPAYVQEFWREKRKSYNFLKHADRDHAKLLDQAHLNNEDLIFQAIGCAAHLNCEMTHEKEMFFAAMVVLGKLKKPDWDSELISAMTAHPPDEMMRRARKVLCYSRVDD